RLMRQERRKEREEDHRRLDVLLAESDLGDHPAVALLRRRGAMQRLSSMELYRMMVDSESAPSRLRRGQLKQMERDALRLTQDPWVPSAYNHSTWEDTARHEAGHAVT